MTNKFEIIAETAFSHEGDLNYLKKQIENAYEAKVDYIKFQIFFDKNASYTKNTPFFDRAENWMFSEKEWIEIFKLSKKLNLKIIALPLNIPSLLFCKKNNQYISAYEVHSVCLNEHFLLKELNSINKKIILGIGGRIPSEIHYAFTNINVNLKNIILMYGFQSFPTEIEKINLLKIKKFKNMFNTTVGYADHTRYDSNIYHNLNEYAYIFGAILFEKHIVLKKGKKRVDYESGIVSEDFIEMRKRLNILVKILGNGNCFELNDKELKYKNREKQIVSALHILANQTITHNDLTYKNSNRKSDFEQRDINRIIGRKSRRDITPDSCIKFEDI